MEGEQNELGDDTPVLLPLFIFERTKNQFGMAVPVAEMVESTFVRSVIMERRRNIAERPCRLFRVDLLTYKTGKYTKKGL